MSSLPNPIPPTAKNPLSLLKRLYSIYTPGELKQRRRELAGDKYLIEGLLPERCLNIVVGDSGLGKSPFLYQAALCVAQGVPFMGSAVSQGRVLYFDFENGLGQVDDMTDRLARHLGLQEKPQDLLLWNFNDANPKWQPDNLSEMVRDAKPAWIIIDSLSAYSPDIEDKSSNVTRVYQNFRALIREVQTTITMVHHLKKPSSKPGEAPPSLQDDPRRWFLQTRGSRQLINGTDVRIGIDQCGHSGSYTEAAGNVAEVAFVLAGFTRVRGGISPMFVGRALDEDEEPFGYQLLSGSSLLFNSSQEFAYAQLPSAFKFKEGRACYGKGAQATTDFLRKCVSVGILEKVGKEYRKVSVADQLD